MNAPHAHADAAYADVTPSLDAGLTLLRLPSERSTALYRLVVSALARRDGPAALWIDGGNVVSTYALHDLAPSPRALSGLRVARAFTAYQHHALVRELPGTVTSRTGLVVAPAFGALYRDDDVPDYDRRVLFEAGLSICAGIAESCSIPVLVADAGDDELSALAADYADSEIDCERTCEGVAYRGADVETLGYWGRGYWQTTIPYWVELFGVADPEEAFAHATTGQATIAPFAPEA